MIIINSLKCKKLEFVTTTLTSQIYAEDIIQADNSRWTLAVIHLKLLLYLSSSYQRGRDGVVGIAAGYKP